MEAMTNVVPMTSKHPLIGTWRDPEDATTAEFTITARSGGLTVSGCDHHDGEAFQISDVSWDGKELRFRTLMPSTGFRQLHVFRPLSETTVEHEFTTVETWLKKEG
jgi:hypothetical protein